MLRAGVPLVHPAVLQGEDRLGLPDLLRRTDRASALGAHAATRSCRLCSTRSCSFAATCGIWRR
jgi:hypothetical protein